AVPGAGGAAGPDFARADRHRGGVGASGSDGADAVAVIAPVIAPAPAAAAASAQKMITSPGTRPEDVSKRSYFRIVRSAAFNSGPSCTACPAASDSAASGA